MHFVRLFWRAGKRWFEADASRSAAAFAYFTPFALVPLILISVTIVGWITDEAAFAALLQQWGDMLGVGATELITTAVQNYDPEASSYGVPIFGVVFFATMIVLTMNNLSAGLRSVWGVTPKGLWGAVETAVRALIFFVVLQLFFVALFLVEVGVPFFFSDIATVPLQRFLLFVATVVLFTIGYGLLSWDAPSWAARFSGALVVSIIFIFMRTIVGLWLYFTPAVEQYGGAGFIFGLLVWIYITAMVIFYGAAYAWAFDHDRVSRRRSRV